MQASVSIRRFVFRVLQLLIGLVLLAVLVTVVQVAILTVHNPESTAWMRMRVRQVKAEGKELQIKRAWVPLSAIPKHVQQAVIAAEDEKFFQHRGFDWEAIRKARAHNERLERVKLGGSTITQQLAKNLYLSPSRTYLRKGREAFITVIMELLLSKRRILELYLNSIEWGPGVFGIEAAARHHFGIPACQLTLDQACRLAAIIPAPLRYRVNGAYVSRRAAVLAQIVGGPSATESRH